MTLTIIFSISLLNILWKLCVHLGEPIRFSVAKPSQLFSKLNCFIKESFIYLRGSAYWTCNFEDNRIKKISEVRCTIHGSIWASEKAYAASMHGIGSNRRTSRFLALWRLLKDFGPMHCFSLKDLRLANCSTCTKVLWHNASWRKKSANRLIREIPFNNTMDRLKLYMQRRIWSSSKSWDPRASFAWHFSYRILLTKGALNNWNEIDTCDRRCRQP